eukprot:SAG31_NODE_70_length_28117_cov_100.521843_26_plen_105_part_00
MQYGSWSGFSQQVLNLVRVPYTKVKFSTRVPNSNTVVRKIEAAEALSRAIVGDGDRELRTTSGSASAAPVRSEPTSTCLSFMEHSRKGSLPRVQPVGCRRLRRH